MQADVLPSPREPLHGSDGKAVADAPAPAPPFPREEVTRGRVNVSAQFALDVVRFVS